MSAKSSPVSSESLWRIRSKTSQMLMATLSYIISSKLWHPTNRRCTINLLPQILPLKQIYLSDYPLSETHSSITTTMANCQQLHMFSNVYPTNLPSVIRLHIHQWDGHF